VALLEIADEDENEDEEDPEAARERHPAH